ncbi:MAG: hypothetical protein CM15mP106_6520 [Candidatus Neomarinimicrobiota bacterium]|nr:MAG: hypothetical protein CM15mP106_6520 [Candidatus Neomarinimicrobiota bacterium]
MLSELDPYTSYMEKEEKDGIEINKKGSMGELGFQLGREGKLTVITPMDNLSRKACAGIFKWRYHN